MRNSSYVPHYAISSGRYSTGEFNTGAEPFMVAIIIIIWEISVIWDKREKMKKLGRLLLLDNTYDEDMYAL